MVKGIARFSEEWIESVKSAWDIVEVIGRRIQLKQAGRNFVGLCPFHDEKTPSFSVNPEKQFYHCFGCQSGGNVINFVMQTEHLSFPEAVSKLAIEKGIEVPALSNRDKELEEKREELRQVNELAARYFYRMLRQPVGEGARTYLEGRGISESLARSFYLGYASEAWDGLSRFLQDEGVDLQVAQEAGLVNQGSRGYIDRFRGRLIFPICDHLGRFVGFGGRSLGQSQPKYLNSGQTPVFNKNSLLYGLNWSKDEIKTADQAILVEGFTDLISLFAAGKKNAVASLGTAFSSNHAKLLSRFTSQVVIAFDGDTAGQNATLRSMAILHDNGLQVRVAVLPGDQDPDSFVRTHPKADVDAWLTSARPFREYQIDRIISQHDVETREGKLTASTELVTVLAQLSNFIERDEYIRYSALRLGVAEQSLVLEVNQKLGIDLPQQVHNRQSTKIRMTRRIPAPTVATGDELVEREILRYLLQNPARVGSLQHQGIKASDFQHPEYRHLFDLLAQNQSDHQGGAIAQRLLGLGELPGSWEDYVQPFLLVLSRRRLQKIEEKLSYLENDSRGFDIRMELYRLLKEYYDISITKS